MTRFSIPDSERIPLPTSGELVGWLADYLRVKGALKETPGADERTARRYFAGERIEPEKREAILRQLVEALEPRAIVDEAVVLGLPSEWLYGYVRMLIDQWDSMSSALRVASFPITEITNAGLPFLRMVVLDAGLRVAAYFVLRELAGGRAAGSLEWLAHSALRQAMDACIQRCHRKPTLNDLRAEAKVSKNSLDEWRAGTQIPHDENLRQVAACLAARGAGDEAQVLAELRLGTAVTAGWNALAGVLSHREWLEDYANALRSVVKHAVPYFRLLPLAREQRTALAEVVLLGAHCDAGAAGSMHLASLAPMSQEVQADLVALPGNWPNRINEHLKALGTIPAGVRHFLEAKGRASPAEVSKITFFLMLQHFKMGGWDAKVEDYPHMVTVSGPAEVKAMNRLSQASTWWSAGQRAEALVHLRRAIELDPTNGSLHYQLGSYLGILLLEEGRIDLLDESLLELRMAVELGKDDPQMGKLALTEIGIVQSNAGLLDEALATFAEAERHAESWSHFWSVRGSTFMWAGRLDEASRCFHRALELQPDNTQTLERLAAVLAALGHTRRSRELAKKVEHYTGRNPEPVFDRILNSAPRRQR